MFWKSAMDKHQDRKIGSVKGAISSYRQQIHEGKPTKKKFQTNYAEKPYTKTRELHQAKRESIKYNESRKSAEAESKVYKKEEWSCEDSEFAEVVRELESVKLELGKLKQDIGSILEEKKRAERETETSMSRKLPHSHAVETLTKKIEEINEEHVLVELARLEAIQEQREIEAQRKQNASAQIEETRKIMRSMIQQIEDTNDLETEQANTKVERSLMESITREIEDTRKELDSIKAESFDFMASMDIVRNEYKHVTEETDRFKSKEEKANSTIQNLTSKLLRAKSKLESTSAASDKAKSDQANLTATLEQIKSEAKAAEIEQSLISEETDLAKAEIERTESEIISKDEKLQAAMQDLKTVKSSESSALEKLKSLIQETIRNRASASQNSSTISISKFEYDYLKGHASAAIEVADKKVAAARAWVEALKANEREIQIKTDLLRKESREQKNLVEEDEFEKWRKQMGSEKLRQGNVKKSASPLMDASPRSKSITVRRRKKVAPNQAKLLSGRSMENNL